ncbi:hypothetical protein KY285_023383 [Solanum tuberosum]|nr:hypothetical protein KY289_023717 [Solanum tuberosum]KAH0675582.1 hypothetical protein KY285_023383 [Solanum tuberosum]
MAGKGKNLGSKAKRRSCSSKVGLQFPVARISRFLKVGKYAKRVGAGALVFLVVLLEYLETETRIIPRHMQLAISFDKVLNQFLRDVTIPNGGVIPRIHNIFLPNNKSNTSKVVAVVAAQEEEEED